MGDKFEINTRKVHMGLIMKVGGKEGAGWKSEFSISDAFHNFIYNLLTSNPCT